jgi:hypothetical protein
MVVEYQSCPFITLTFLVYLRTSQTSRMTKCYISIFPSFLLTYRKIAYQFTDRDRTQSLLSMDIRALWNGRLSRHDLTVGGCEVVDECNESSSKISGGGT